MRNLLDPLTGALANLEDTVQYAWAALEENEYGRLAQLGASITEVGKYIRDLVDKVADGTYPE